MKKISIVAIILYILVEASSVYEGSFNMCNVVWEVHAEVSVRWDFT